MARPSQRITLSVILPAYNEQDRLPPYLTSIMRYLSQRGDPYEIVVVDDGSRDQTAPRIREFAVDRPVVRLIQLPRNSGKGAAVRAGMLAAHGTLRLMTDADGATPIQEIERLEHALSEDNDLAIGSRFLGSRDSRYRVQARWHRTVLGNTFNRMAQRLGLEGITDTQCGFKLFRKRVAEDLFSISRIDGYGFDLELLYVARHRNYRIAEVPINWTDQPGSKVHVVRDGLRMFRELLAVRRHAAQGAYQRRESADRFQELCQAAESRRY
ncbi:MAG TPA: dolichyl-phosphate beta-glucosyltransferase [Nitrospiraceae bacterium]|nr:dolichyl-phosphate beta-glucosyltransferase [Nitrospiraceae bacterium]